MVLYTYCSCLQFSIWSPRADHCLRSCVHVKRDLALSILSAERDTSRHPSCPTTQSWSMDCGQLNRMSVLFQSALSFSIHSLKALLLMSLVSLRWRKVLGQDKTDLAQKESRSLRMCPEWRVLYCPLSHLLFFSSFLWYRVCGWYSVS